MIAINNIFLRLVNFLGILVLSFVTYAAEATTSLEPAETRDCQSIQSALDSLPTSGGEIRLEAEQYLCKKPLIIAKNNVRLLGQGSATLLKLADGANAPVVIMGSAEKIPTFSVRHVEIANLAIDGNRRQQTTECMGGGCSAKFPLRNNGISVRRCIDCKIHSVVVYAAKSGGLVTELGSRRLHVSEYTSYDNEFDGLAGYETEDSTFTGLTLYSNLAAGISTDIRFNNNQFFNITLNDNRSVGIFMRDSSDNAFSNIHIRNSGQHGIFVAQVDEYPGTAASGNTFSNLVVSGSGGWGVRVNDGACTNNLLVGAQLIDNREGCFSDARNGLTGALGLVCR